MANPFSQNQLTFASRFIGDTGLDGGVVMAWMAAEEPPGANATVGNNNQDWLNIGGQGGRAGAGNSIWQDPNAAADATANWIKGTWSDPGFGRASIGIQGILNSVGQSPQAQMNNINASGWLPGGYSDFPQLYSQYKGDAPGGTSTPFSTPAGQSSGAGVFMVGETTNPNEDYWPLALDTPISTPDGWTTMNDLNVGDQVLGTGNQPVSVTGISQVRTGHKCFRVHLDDGTSIVADEIHRWPTDMGVRPTPHLAGRQLGDTTVLRVEPTTSVPVKCIEVGSADHLYLAGEAMVPACNTAINRYAQEVNWYVYARLDSPNSVLFLADGTALLDPKTNQPVATIDRWRHQDKIMYIDFTWDNTALEFKQQHKKRKPKQSASRVAKVTSPTECQLHLICNIDAFNPGDCIQLTSCGPGNGPWLIGEVRRSVFQIYSELSLVPGITPITANAPGSTITKDISEQLGQNAGGSQAGGSGGSGPLASVGGYVNPLAKIQNLAPSRVDMGVDYTGSGPLLAIGDGQIKNLYNSGWPGGTYIVLQLSGGAYAGKLVYYAENITPSVQIGQNVKAGDQVGILHNVYPYMEIGWSADTAGTTLAASLNQQASGDPGGWSSAAGVSFNNLLKSLGAPSGIIQAGGGHGTMPAGYP